MARKPNISVLGSYNATDDEISLSYELGKTLANQDLNVISGGQKGVMLGLCKGIYENRDKNQGAYCTIIGILPSKGFAEGNEFLDVAIPTGADALQNTLVP
ncbi:MAG: SLOG cluster 4 domain-containing protein, partial [Nitrososphaeraceae archaeon]